MAKSKFFPALATLVGTVIGAGFLGIPYVVSKSGFFMGVIWLILIAAIFLLVKLYLGEISLRTKGNHQLTGYAARYLGKNGKILMFLAVIFGVYPALLAYLIGEGKSLSYIFLGTTNYSFVFSIIFWMALSALTFRGLKALKKYEKISMIIVLSLVFIIFIMFFPKIKITNLTYTNNDLFAPFGLIMFSFLAFSAMPEVERILKGQENLMKKVIILGTLIPLAVYFLFTLVMVGISGQEVNEIATLNMGKFVSLLGIMTMFTAFFASSLAIRDMFRFDFNLGRFKGWLLSSLIPLALFIIVYFFNLVGFVQLLSISGIVSGGMTGILVLIMNLKAKKLGNRKPEYSIKINKLIILAISLVFILGVILELLLYIK